MNTNPTWPDLARLAAEISEAGVLVTQIHCANGPVPSEWAYSDYTVTIHANAQHDMVVTTDGRRWTLDGEVQP